LLSPTSTNEPEKSSGGLLMRTPVQNTRTLFRIQKSRERTAVKLCFENEKKKNEEKKMKNTRFIGTDK